MPWNDNHYPSSMLHLTPIVRRKAIEIANALLAEGYDDGRAIRIAIAQAKRWALHASPVNSHEEGPERGRIRSRPNYPRHVLQFALSRLSNTRLSVKAARTPT